MPYEWFVPQAPARAIALGLREARQILERALHARASTERRTLEVERRRRDVPAAVEFAEQAGLWNAYVVEKDLVEALTVRHVDQRPHADAGRLHVHEEVTDAAVLRRVGIGARDHEHPVGVVRLAGPDLLSVEDELVAIRNGARLQRCEIGAGVWFAVPLAPDDLAGRDARQVLRLLLVVAVEDDRRAEITDGGGVDDRRARVAHRLVVNDLIPVRQFETAVLLRPRRRDPAFRRQLLQELPPELVRLVVDRVVRAFPVSGQRVLEERVDFAAECLLFCREFETHCLLSVL